MAGALGPRLAHRLCRRHGPLHRLALLLRDPGCRHDRRPGPAPARAQAAAATASQGGSAKLESPPDGPHERGGAEAPALTVFNTLGKAKQRFTPRPGRPDRVSMYCCGVTVYDLSHIGHARVYCVFDVLFRLLRELGFRVEYVRNVTDIDDKILRRARELGEDPLHLSGRFLREFQADMAALHCLPPTAEPRATDFVPQMVAEIERMVAAGKAYAPGNGDVYFAVEAAPGYGRLSGRSLEDQQAGYRVAVDEAKRCPHDFVLWKGAKPGEPTWESPWGPGRPGWHLECSTMIRSLMGPVIDIHGGGRDLISPHHDNELLQSEAAATCEERQHMPNGGLDFVRYWMHVGFVSVDSEKMSKSLGNFFTIREVLARFPALGLRWALLGTHYRNPLAYAPAALAQATERLFYTYQTLADCEAALAAAAEAPSSSPAGGEGKALWETVRGALCSDLDTPTALAALSPALKQANDLMHTKQGRKAQGRLELLASLHGGLRRSLALLGLDSPTQEALSEIRSKALLRAGLSEADVQAGIARRQAARAARDYAAADAERAALVERGIFLMDSAEGTGWRPGLAAGEAPA